MTPKYLRQYTTGRVYAYAPELAKRKDMVPVTEEAPRPELKFHAEDKHEKRHGEGKGKGKGVQVPEKQPAGRLSEEGNAPEGGEGEKGSA